MTFHIPYLLPGTIDKWDNIYNYGDLSIVAYYHIYHKSNILYHIPINIQISHEYHNI